MTTLRYSLGLTVGWILLCILMFDRWFFFSPLGIILTFGLPSLGWYLWWRYAPAKGHEISEEERQLLEKSIGWLQSLKNRFNRQ